MKQEGYLALSPGEQLLHAMYSLTNMVKIYQGNNQLIHNCIDKLVKSLALLLSKTDLAEITVQLEGGRFFINEEKLLRRRGAAEQLLGSFFEFLSVRGIGELKILSAVLSAPTESLVSFAVMLNECVEKPESAAWLGKQLHQSGIEWVSVRGGAETPEGQGGGGADGEQRPLESPGKRSPQKIYAYALRSLMDVAQKISVNQRGGMRKAVRMVQIMAEEVLLQEQPLLLAMSTIRSYDDYTFTHSVNVAILSLYIGRELGLPKETMECLGVCGLFHDLGKVMLPYDLLNKPESLTTEEYEQVRRHSLNSTRMIVQLLSAPVERKSRIMIPPFEHHLNFDLTGYPVIGWERPISLCGRILAIADVYDALTSPRVYRKEAMSSDRALGLMLKGQGTVFDPVIFKVFVRMLGVYPIGTLLELDSNEIALVSKTQLNDDLNRPWVVILQGDGQGGFIRGDEVNLAERDESGGYCRHIVASAHPSSRNIQPAEFLT